MVSYSSDTINCDITCDGRGSGGACYDTTIYTDYYSYLNLQCLGDIACEETSIHCSQTQAYCNYVYSKPAGVYYCNGSNPECRELEQPAT